MTKHLKSKREILAAVGVSNGMAKGTSVAIKPCNCCGTQQVELLYRQARFPLVKCTTCGLVYADEHFREEDLRGFYTGDYYTRAYVCHPPNVDRKLAIGYLRAFDKVDRLLGGGRVLDFGCARGTFLAELRRGGYEPRWELHGVDINEDEIRMGTDRGLPVQCLALEEACFKDGEFDAVTAFSVVEHLQDPIRVFDELARILRPGGLFLVIVPSREALIIDVAMFASRVFGDLARGFTDNVFHEEHLYYFTPESLARGLGLAGFETLQFFGTPSYLEANPPGVMVPLGAYTLRFLSWALRRQTMLGVVACRR